MKTALGLMLVASVACGGATVDPIQDGGPVQDGGPTACPSSQPAQYSACDRVGLSCEYGNDPNLQCNVVAQCTNAGWQLTDGAPECPTPPNPSACPATFASVPVGQHCGDLVGTTCSYPQGFCGCSVGSGGPYPEDASAVATWVCDAPEPGCPQPRPKLGSACSQEGLACDYSSCSLPTGTSIVCQDGTWQNQPFGCAL